MTGSCSVLEKLNGGNLGLKLGGVDGGPRRWVKVCVCVRGGPSTSRPRRARTSAVLFGSSRERARKRGLPHLGCRGGCAHSFEKVNAGEELFFFWGSVGESGRDVFVEVGVGRGRMEEHVTE